MISSEYIQANSIENIFSSKQLQKRRAVDYNNSALYLTRKMIELIFSKQLH